jgi:hypothetical protein
VGMTGKQVKEDEQQNMRKSEEQIIDILRETEDRGRSEGDCVRCPKIVQSFATIRLAGQAVSKKGAGP